jgi:hypothetical protein
MRARCSDSFTRNTGVACLSLYHFDWNTPSYCLCFAGRGVELQPDLPVEAKLPRRLRILAKLISPVPSLWPVGTSAMCALFLKPLVIAQLSDKLPAVRC